MGRNKQVTLRDVAAAAEVSPATVSLVLNNRTRGVAAATRRRVLSKAKELRYKPTGAGRPLRYSQSRKHRSVVLLVSQSPETIGNTIYSQVQNGLEWALQRVGIDLVIQHTGASRLTPGAVGVVVIGSLTSEKRRLIGELPVVICMGLFEGPAKVDHITYCNSEIGDLAARYLLERGHRRFGALAVKGTIFTERVDGFVKTVRDAGRDCCTSIPARHRELVDAPEELAQILATCFRRLGEPAPTAVFIPADSLTAIAYPVFYSMNIEPGGDIDIVSCNNEYHDLKSLLPRPAVVDIRAREVGRLGAQQLLARLEDPTPAPPVRIELHPSLIPAGKYGRGRHWSTVHTKAGVA